MTNEYYIEEDFAVLAGPFANNKTEQKFKNNVIEDLKRGNIPWIITFEENGEYVERKGMILPRRKP